MTYKQTKFILNAILIQNKLPINCIEMSIIDNLFSAKLLKNVDLLKKDYFSLLHLILLVMKEVPDVSIRLSLKKTFQLILESLQTLNDYSEI